MKPPAAAIEPLLTGMHADPFALMGPREGHESYARVRFAVLASNARLVSLVGDFNDWNATLVQPASWQRDDNDWFASRDTMASPALSITRIARTRPACLRRPPSFRNTRNNTLEYKR